MTQLHLQLLGAFAATLDDRSPVVFEYDKVRALLAFLAVESQRPHRRDALCGLLWPEDDQPHARQSLSQALYSLRRSLANAGSDAEYLLANRVEMGLDPDADWQADVNAFQRLVAAGLDAGSDAPDPHRGAALLAQAVGRYSGPFLEGFILPDSSAWDEWALLQRERLHRLATDALRSLVRYYEEQDAPEEALHWACRFVELDPWQEDAHRHVMKLLAALGRRGEALAQFEICRRTLQDDLDVEPTEETLALHRLLREGMPFDASAQARPAGGGTAGAVRKRLPAPRAGFVGRERELVHIHRRLADPTCRLLTVVGLGGIGKTQLALHAVRSPQRDFTDGIVFVPLVAVDTTEGVISAIRTGLGASPTASVELLVDTLQPLELLLVLDNCEHLTASAGLFAHLLERAAGLKILATSRERLNLREEWLLPLVGLPVPPAVEQERQTTEMATLDAFDGTRLFVNCLRHVRPGLRLTPQDAVHIVHICHLLEGMPLALELTAAWHRVLPLDRIAAQARHILDLPPAATVDLPDRHRSMRAVFDHSWGLLPPHAADLLRGFSVFRGGFTLEAAQAVTGAGLSDVADLVDRSWVRVDATGRYDLHELVRQYCAERLQNEHTDAGQAACNRHAAFFAAFLEGQEERYNRESSALAHISIEIGNVRAAWRWTTQMGDAETALPLCTGLFFISDMWGWFGLVEPLFDQGVEALQTHLQAEAQEPAQLDAVAVLIARILHAQGDMLSSQARLPAAWACARQAEAYARQAEPNLHQAFALIYARLLQAGILGARNEFDEAERILREEVIPYWETATTSDFQGPDFSLSNAYMSLGAVLASRGRYEAARQLLERSLAVKERCDEFRFRAVTYNLLAGAYAGLGEEARALEAALEGERLSREYGDRVNLSFGLRTTGSRLLAGGQVDEARRRYQEAMDVDEETGNRTGLTWTLIGLSKVALAENRVAEATRLADDAVALYRREEMESVNLLSEMLLTRSKCALAANQPDRAEERLRQLLALPRCSPPYRQAAEEALANCRREAKWTAATT